jgi:hypothetical protein
LKFFQIAGSEHKPVEGEPVAETSSNKRADSLPVPVTPITMKGREECKMLQKAFTILTSSAVAAASADNER